MRHLENKMIEEKVVVVPYDPIWPALFHEIGLSLRQTLGDIALRIDHIGSTSVPGLDAKPVIDVQISVRSFKPLDAYRLPLETLGYVFKANNPDRSKRYFREPPGRRRTHIHVRQAGSWAEQMAVLFRDYLRTHPDDAMRYAELKYRLAEKFGDDREGYTEAKEPFIWEILRRANRWSQASGWEPGQRDI
jgi:GrpB-like predicted nucleotidyltransferase (UPF0157 family)